MVLQPRVPSGCHRRVLDPGQHPTQHHVVVLPFLLHLHNGTDEAIPCRGQLPLLQLHHHTLAQTLLAMCLQPPRKRLRCCRPRQPVEHSPQSLLHCLRVLHAFCPGPERPGHLPVEQLQQHPLQPPEVDVVLQPRVPSGCQRRVLDPGHGLGQHESLLLLARHRVHEPVPY